MCVLSIIPCLKLVLEAVIRLDLAQVHAALNDKVGVRSGRRFGTILILWWRPGQHVHVEIVVSNNVG